MTSRTVVAFSTVILLGAASLAGAQETIKDLLPESPAGFDWVAYGNSAFLKPRGWNQRAIEAQPDRKVAGAVAVSPEPFSEQSFFEHGFTAQIVADFKEVNNNIPPAKGALLILKKIADQHQREEILLFDSRQVQVGEAFVLRYRDAPQGKTPIVVHKYLIANDRFDTLHIFTYESPAASWDDNWKTFGTPILQRILVAPFLPASP